MTDRFLRASLTGLTVSLAIGPATPDSRLLSTWRQVNLQGMGFVTGALAHPTEPDLVYVRTDVGGMYRWDVTASAWIPLNDNKGTGYGIESFALDRSDPNLLYAGIGDRDTGRVWKSEDRGQSWQATGLVLEMEPNGDWRRCGERMAVDPHDGNRVYYGSVAHGLWTSRDRGTTWSSADTSALPAGIDGGQVCVLCDPSSGSPGNACRVVYVAVHGHGLFRSVDSGKSWDPVPGGPDTSSRPIHGAVTLGGNVYLTYHGATGALYTCDQESALRDITPPNAG